MEPHFDAGGICEQVLEQDLGLWISTNNPGAFRRTMYAHMRAHPQHKLHIVADPRSPTRFALLKRPPQETITQLTEESPSERED